MFDKFRKVLLSFYNKRIKENGEDKSIGNEYDLELKYGDILEDIILNLEKINSFEVKNNEDKYIQFFNDIKNIYIQITVYLLSGYFRNDFSSNYTNIVSLIKSKKDEFERKNISSNNDKIFIKIIKILENLSIDFGYIFDLNHRFDNKRNDILFVEKPSYLESDNEDYRSIFLILRFALFSDLVLINYYSDGLAGALLSKYRELNNLSYNDDNLSWIIKIIQDKLFYNVYKIGIISGRKDFEIYKDKSIEKIGIRQLEQSVFSVVKKDFNFIHNPSNNELSDFEFHLKTLHESNFKNTLSLRIIINYYKEKLKNLENVENIFNEYKRKIDYKYSSKNIINYINYIYIGNSYLSLLIEEYHKEENSKLSNKIESLFEELTINKKEKFYKNYFTFFKYSIYKKYEFENFINNGKFSKAKGALRKSKLNLDKSFKLFNSDIHYEYYEFNDNDNYLYTKDKLSDKIKKIFSYNLYVSPFNIHRNRKRLEKFRERLFKAELDLAYAERLNSVENKINSYKSEAMTIIGIFTGIVVYSFGTIQLFSIIEDIGSAILFSGVFLSGILFLLSSIFYSSNIKFFDDKGVRIFIAGLLVLLLVFIGKFTYSGKLLNGNRGQSIYNKLEGKIIEGENIKDYIDEKIKKYDKINKEIKNNLIKLEKIKK